MALLVMASFSLRVGGPFGPGERLESAEAEAALGASVATELVAGGATNDEAAFSEGGMTLGAADELGTADELGAEDEATAGADGALLEGSLHKSSNCLRKTGFLRLYSIEALAYARLTESVEAIVPIASSVEV